MRSIDRILRRLVPAVPKLSHNRLLMAPLDLLDRLISAPFGVGTTLPPNRLRIRVGAGNRILFNQMVHRSMPINFWLNAFASGLVRLDSRILDVGSGCGRFAWTLRSFSFCETRFTGQYTGIDVDPEMVEWCRAHFPSERFTFKLSRAYSKVYNPEGDPSQALEYDVEDGSQDFVFSNSLLTHLLPADCLRCLEESYRVLAPGAAMLMTFFCMDHLTDVVGGRWTFRHRSGDAYIENPKYPEAAVAYPLDFIQSSSRQVGFTSIEVLEGGAQSVLRARKPTLAKEGEGGGD